MVPVRTAHSVRWDLTFGVETKSVQISWVGPPDRQVLYSFKLFGRSFLPFLFLFNYFLLHYQYTPPSRTSTQKKTVKKLNKNSIRNFQNNLTFFLFISSSLFCFILRKFLNFLAFFICCYLLDSVYKKDTIDNTCKVVDFLMTSKQVVNIL